MNAPTEKKTNSAGEQPKAAAPSKAAEAAEETFTLSAAAKATGRSYTNLQGSAEKLAAAGAKVEGKGSQWSIPKSVLVKIGWLDENGQPTKTRATRGSKSTTPATSAEQSIGELAKAYETAQRNADELRGQAKDAANAAKDAKRALDAAVAAAEENFKRAQEDLELAKKFASIS